MPNKFSLLTEAQRGEHSHFPAGVDCAYWGEYTSYEHTGGKLADFSSTNRLVSNLKKTMDRRDKSDFRYKKHAIIQCAGALIRLVDWDEVKQKRIVFVPIPPSRARGDINYDARMVDILNFVKKSRPVLDIRDCLSFDGRHVASHKANARPTIDELYDALQFDGKTARVTDPPGEIVLFDDMLTTGAHFVAVSRKLSEKFPSVPISACFIARRALPDLSDAFQPITEDFC